LKATSDVAYRLGRSAKPRGVSLLVPWDRTTGVFGPQGSGKTLDLLVPALLEAPGGAIATLTKLNDLLLTITSRASGNRPVAVLDPFDIAPGAPPLVWDPVAGCVDPMTAERRAKAFGAGTVGGAVSAGKGDDAARFYAAECAKVLQAYLHAAALTGRTLDHVLRWVAEPSEFHEPLGILSRHPDAAPMWDGLLRGALSGDDRTAGNTATTAQQAFALFFQPAIRARCVPRPGRPATDIAQLIERRGTIYLLGREDPYSSASPLMTALAEHVLDTARAMASAAPWGRLCPPFLACLDELPPTTPLPTLPTGMANDRALGIAYIYGTQTWRQLVVCYGEETARALFGLTNNIVVFGGSKDGAFNNEISDLLGSTRRMRSSRSSGPGGGSTNWGAETEPILRPEEIRMLPQRRALILAENAAPFIARMHRCIDGRAGRELLRAQEIARDAISAERSSGPDLAHKTATAVATAQALRLHAGDDSEA
jgi:type IV secretion system protein VirD4